MPNLLAVCNLYFYSIYQLQLLCFDSLITNRCIPYKCRYADGISDHESEKIVEVLMINSASGPGLLFPKVQIINVLRASISTKIVISEVLCAATILYYIWCYIVLSSKWL